MRIGDAAAAAGTTPRALRFYEQRGLMPPPVRTSTGQREYGPQDIARVILIRKLLSMGLTVEDVRTCSERMHLIEGDDLPPYGKGACVLASGVVERRLSALEGEIARLVALRDGLSASIRPA